MPARAQAFPSRPVQLVVPLGPGGINDIVSRMIAAKLGDAALREEALAARAELTSDPTWKGLLVLGAAELAAKSGELERALEVLSRAQKEGGAAAWAAATAG